MSWDQFWHTIFSTRTLAAYRLSFETALWAALINSIFGFLIAWVLVRYQFFGKKLVDAAIDLPFALPTAVIGISLADLYSPHGFLGASLSRFGIPTAYTPTGIVIALIFIGLPFVVRTVEPVLQDLDKEAEEAATCLGATKFQTFWKVIFPGVFPSVVTGFSMAFARGVGEYGSVIFIAGNMPFKTEVASLLIVTKLEQFDYAGATAIALAMLAMSFVLLLSISTFQWYSRKKIGAA